jgi:ABC-type glycerol-3-phosphate transport system substrate-binding protein
MRILPVALIGLALLAGCSSSSTQRSAAPATAASGSAATMDTTAQGDSIDRFAAAFEAQHPMRY